MDIGNHQVTSCTEHTLDRTINQHTDSVSHYTVVDQVERNDELGVRAIDSN